MKILQVIKTLNRVMTHSSNLIVVNRTVRKTTNEILANLGKQLEIN